MFSSEDVVRAYKGVLKEKTALEETLKALSVRPEEEGEEVGEGEGERGEEGGGGKGEREEGEEGGGEVKEEAEGGSRRDEVCM